MFIPGILTHTAQYGTRERSHKDGAVGETDAEGKPLYQQHAEDPDSTAAKGQLIWGSAGVDSGSGR
jgi:hypothetical protein